MFIVVLEYRPEVCKGALDVGCRHDTVGVFSDELKAYRAAWRREILANEKDIVEFELENSEEYMKLLETMPTTLAEFESRNKEFETIRESVFNYNTAFRFFIEEFELDVEYEIS